VLTLGLLLLLATFRGGQEAGAWVTAQLTAVGGPAWVGPIVERAVNLIINAGLLMLAYMTIPNTSIPFRPALTGGAVAGVLFEIAKGLFTLFLGSGGVERLYGALAVLPLFLLWLYVTWVVVLLGLQIAYAMQHFDSWVERFDPSSRRPATMEPSIALAVAGYVARRFRDGKQTDLIDAADYVSAPANAVLAVILRLAEGGVLVRVGDDDGEESFTLAKPAEAIAAADVLAIGERLVQNPQQGPEAGVMRELASARREALGNRTLADVAGLVGTN
jgi:membrane protein